MNGAIFFATKYGSTAQYAEWIAEATGLPAFEMEGDKGDPADFDFLVIGAPVYYNKILNRQWVKCHLRTLMERPVLFFTVSGAPGGPKLDKWIARSLPTGLLRHMSHIVLQGRQNPADLSWFDRMMLIVGGLFNPDRAAAREEIMGFDFMDKVSIAPIVQRVRELSSES